MHDPRILPFRGTSPRLGADVFIADTARVIGDVVLGAACSVWFGSVLRGDVHAIRLGRRVNVQDLSIIHVTSGKHGTDIGDDVTIGHRAILHGCTVRDRVLIGMGAIVMDAAVVGEDSLVGAGALVTPGTQIPPRSLVIGSPARVKRALTAEELAEIHDRAGHYAELAGAYMAEGGYGRIVGGGSEGR